jgi:hypothetical protein
MKRWEYQILTLGGPILFEKALNKYGDEGWELVQVKDGRSDNQPTFETIWKRPKSIQP